MENQSVDQNQNDLQKNSTLEPISQNSIGTKAETRTCNKHGEYQAKVLIVSPITGKDIRSACPKCQNEWDAQQDARKREIEESYKRTRYERSGIPERFKGKTLEDMKSTSTKHKSILKTIGNYKDALVDGRHTSLILCGKPGTGKTHIGCALVSEVIDKCKKQAHLTTTVAMLRKVKSTWGKDSEEKEEDVLDRYVSVPFLVIDEVGVQFGTETEKNILHEIIDRRYSSVLPTVLISNLTSEELTAFIGERAFDRFKEDGGAVLAFDWESHRGK